MSATFRHLGIFARKSTTQLRLSAAQQQHQQYPWCLVANKWLLQRCTATLANGLQCKSNVTKSEGGAAASGYNTMSLLQKSNLFAMTAAPSKYIGRSCNFGTGNPNPANKSETKASPALADSDIFGEASNLGLFAKFKLMYKKYWYVLIPVHVVTSIGWLGGFYYLSKSGVDVPSLLQYLHLSETIIEKVQNSDMGYIAIAYLCYKVATPLRYAVTLGGTTISIKYLVQAGHIKPIPSKKELMQIYEQKKADRAADRAAAKAEHERDDEEIRFSKKQKPPK